MTKEWKVLAVRSHTVIVKEINELTKKGWEVEYIIPGGDVVPGKAFLSKERND